MTLRHLKIFVSVYQHGSVTKAAGELCIAQPSVSLAVSELERYYGVKLFERLSRRLYVTESGREFYGYALHIISLFDEMEQKIRNWDSLGVLRLGSSITIGNFLLPPMIKRFEAEHPGVRVTASICNSAKIEEQILDNRIDLALVEGIPGHPKIRQIPFMDDRLCLICGPSHPLAEAEKVDIRALEQYDFILREGGSGGRELFESILTLHQVPIKVTWESVSTQAIVKAVALGLGLSVLPRLLVEQDISSGTVLEKEIRDISLSRKFFMIYHQNKCLTKSAESFMKMCLSWEPGEAFS